MLNQEAWKKLGVSRVKVWVYCPVENLEEVRLAIGEAGGGVIGNYRYCSFVVKGTGHFLPDSGANPAIGEVGTVESVPEGRIEFECPLELADKMREAILGAHPYEEVPIDVLPLLEFS